MNVPIFKLKLIALAILIGLNACGINKKNSEATVFQPNGDNHIFPQPVGYINDFEGVFSQSQIKELNSLIVGHYMATTDQIAIVTIQSIEPYEDIHEYTIDLANYWRIGHNDQKNGVLIAFSTKLKKVRIQNGIGTESRLSDETTMEIIDRVIIPEFKGRNYFEGVKKGLLEVINNLNNKEI